MENAADALKMAFGVLVFVIAISISIGAFGEARQSIDTIISYRYRETEYILNKNYYESDSTNKLTRKVNIESIIPTIFRAYKENYTIIFDEKIVGKEGLYKKMVENPEKQLILTTIYDINLEKETIGNESDKIRFLNGIIYRDYGSKTEAQFKKDFRIYELNTTSLYNKLIDKGLITEELGIYYQEEVDTISSTPDSNKTRKGIITYKK